MFDLHTNFAVQSKIDKMAAPIQKFTKNLSFSIYQKIKHSHPVCSVRYISMQQSCFSTESRFSSEDHGPVEHDNVDGGSDEHGIYDNLYQGHIQTNFFQKSILAVGAAVMSLYNPARDDMIATLGETTGYYALRNIRKKMLTDPVGRQILEERPVLNSDTISVDYLGSLPEGTFGKEYWKFLDKNGFSPDARLPVRFVDDDELMYVMLRYRQVHDLFHTLLGMPPIMLGEVAVKWVEAIQTGLPMCMLGAVFGPLRLGPEHTRKHLTTYLPWAIRCGYSAKNLMCVYYEKEWEKDLDIFRKELNVEPAPVPLAVKKKSKS